MGLEEFEKQLAEEKSREKSSHHHRHRRREDDSERRHRHHHERSHRHRDDDRDEDRRHRRHHHRRSSRSRSADKHSHKRHKRSASPSRRAAPPDNVKVFSSPSGSEGDEDEWVEKGAFTAPPEENLADQRDRDAQPAPQRDAWMQEPSALDIDYVQKSRRKKSPPSQFVSAKEGAQTIQAATQKEELMRDLLDSGDDGSGGLKEDIPAQHEVSYTFGDAGSSWRMTKLKAVYRQAEESGKSVDEVALNRYGDFRSFDDAREEEREMDRRKTYGKEYVGLEKPSGELFQERKMKAGIRRESSTKRNTAEEVPSLPQGQLVPESEAAMKTAPLDATALNKLKAQLMKAKLRKAPNVAQLEEEYHLAEAASLANTRQPDVVVLNNMENRMLAGGRSGEVTGINNKRGRERGLVEENDDMSIEDMVRHEKRTRGVAGGEGRAFAERIAKDGKFVDSLDYMDDAASQLSKKVVKSDSQLRNTAIADFQRMEKTLASCPLCHHEDTSTGPLAPVVSLATRTYLTLPTVPEITPGGAMIVPITHHTNLLTCDDDEWEELRNFQKSLTRFYASQNLSVLFYENAAHPSRKPHAALHAIPLPHHLADTAPAFFQEAFRAAAGDWSTHRPVIDTLAKGGKWAFRRSFVPQIPYFHVWFELDGGMGHIVEEDNEHAGGGDSYGDDDDDDAPRGGRFASGGRGKWPKGDLFAREVLGGMFDREMEVVQRQGRWSGSAEEKKRVQRFRAKWEEWDWTVVLREEGGG